MAAPQIPNLNTFRTGAGRDRGRGRGQAPLDEPRKPTAEEEKAARDRIVQHTDHDASVSRLSAVELGYLEDPIAKFFVSSESQRRFPIINRGTYVRTTAIDRLVDEFLARYPTSKKQIISLGAGSDTRYFRIIERETDLSSRRNMKSTLVYHEFDFPENTAQKVSIIGRTSVLCGCVGTPLWFGPEEKSLDGQNYHLHPIDLRSLDADAPVPVAFRNVVTTLPTLIISECCLVYLEPALADKVAKYFTQFLFPTSTPVGMILYEPINPNDAFGKIMVSNLAGRGIVLQTLRKYGSLEAQAARMKAYGFDNNGGADVNELWHKFVGKEEKARVSGLEMLDEVEEWELLAGHYCVVWGWRGGAEEGTWDEWKRLEMQLKTRSLSG